MFEKVELQKFNPFILKCLKHKAKLVKRLYQGIGGWNGASLGRDPPSVPVIREEYRWRGAWSPAAEADGSRLPDTDKLRSGTSAPSLPTALKSCMTSSNAPKEGKEWLNQDNML